MADRTAHDLIRRRLGERAEVLQAVLEGECLEQIAAAAEAVAGVYSRGGKALVFGNGGSAADAVHIAAELVGRYLIERPALPALALVTNPSTLTAIANDYGFEHVFARQIEGLGTAGDAALGLSTSGSSANVVAGLNAAKAAGMVTVALTGSEEGAVGAAAEICIRIPSDEVPSVQEAHMLAAHLICEWVEARMFGDALSA